MRLPTGHPSVATKEEQHSSPSIGPDDEQLEEVDELQEDGDIEMQVPAEQYDDNEDEDMDEDEDEEEIEDPFVFKVRGSLTPYGAEQVTLKELHEWIHEGKININPPYQREPVWPPAKQTTLIDSIFKNYYIPPLVFAVRPNNDGPGQNTWMCIDGKQRLTSIMRFREGRIPHKDTVTGKLWYYTRSEAKQNQSHIELPEEARELFDAKQLTVVQYYGISVKDERKVFERVQLGVPLTAGEKLRAISATKAMWISELEAKHIAIENGIAQYLQTQHNRGKDFQNLAQMVYFCEGLTYREVQLPPPGQPVLAAWLAGEDKDSLEGGGQVDGSFKRDIEDMLLQLRNISSDPRYNTGLKELQQNGKKKFAPIEFVFMGILLYRISDESKSTKAKALCALVKAVRETFIDIRANGTVVKTLWSYCNQLVENPGRAVKVVQVLPAAKKANGKAKVKSKAGEAESEDEGYSPGTGSSTLKAKKTVKKAT